MAHNKMREGRLRGTHEYFCSKCEMLRSKNEKHLSGNCPRCGNWSAKLIRVDWKEEWRNYWDLESYYLGDFKKQNKEAYL